MQSLALQKLLLQGCMDTAVCSLSDRSCLSETCVLEDCLAGKSQSLSGMSQSPWKKRQVGKLLEVWSCFKTSHPKRRCNSSIKDWSALTCQVPSDQRFQYSSFLSLHICQQNRLSGGPVLRSLDRWSWVVTAINKAWKCDRWELAN